MKIPPLRLREFLRAAAWLLVPAFLLVALPRVEANIPGGGTGTGANVTLTVTNSGGVPYTVTLDNGVVNAVIRVNTGQLIKLTYNGVQFTDGYSSSANGCFYWQGAASSSQTLTVVKDPTANGGNIAEISIEDPNSVSGDNADAHRHFIMLRGSPGVYVSQIYTRDSSMAAGGVGLSSFTGKLTASDVLNWLAQDGADPRSKIMQSSSDTAVGGVSDSPKEVTLLTSGVLAGQFDCKYDFAGDMGALTTTGWCGTTGTAGIWIIHPSNEYFTNGPMHREILAQWKIAQATFSGVHFGFNDDNNFAAGETWSRVDGPFFLYANKAPGVSNAPAVMFADAQAQAQAERSAWPYTWFTDGNYTQAAGRGTVTGKIVINDAFNPNASASGLWVGVERQPSSPTTPLPADFQVWGKGYQYWVKTDAAGNFTIPNVIAGSNYTLFAFGPGAIGQFQSQALSGATVPVKIDYPATQFAVTVTGGQTTALGTLTWTPARTGPTVFEIGVPDRNTQEFRHGDDYWHGELGTAAAPGEFWAPFQLFPYEWPGGLNYTVGQSHWATDWDYVQPTIYSPAAGTYGSNSWTVSFNLPSAPAAGVSAFLYLGIASNASGPVIVSVNNVNLGSTSGVTATPSSISSTGFFSAYSEDTPSAVRMSSHSIFCDERLTFPASLLKAGTNTVTLNMRKGGYFANAAAYDYVRLELPGYVPPAPASLTALAGSGAVNLRWPAAPGATSYKVLRSTTSGSGYAMLASGITGPVCGSTPDTVTYTDATAANGTAYYYVVQSVNTVGTSANSAQAAATASASAASAPAAPTGLAATSGNMQVALTWNAVTNAAYYVVKRSPASGGPYTVISDTAKTNSYTDPGRTNGMTYFYVVDAANAAGTGADSAEAASRPLPPTLTVGPSDLAASNNAGVISLTWTPAANATGYTLQRATASSGPYTTLTTTQYAASYADTAAPANTTCYYQIAASNLAGTTAFGTPVSILTPPVAPTALTATGAASRVTLNWSASTGATGYTVSRSTTSGGSYTVTASNVAGTTYTDRTVANGTAYYYVVAANNAGGTGAASAEATATPAGVTTLTWTGSVSGTWDTSTANWLSAGTAAAYADGQAVFFDDTASNYAVTLGGTVSPADVVFSDANAYTFTAAGLSGATGLTKNGTGALTISGVNTYSGGTSITGGSVVIGGGSTNTQNGLGTGPVTLQGGTLVMNGYTGSATPSYGALANNLVIPAGAAGTLDFTQRGSFGGTVTGGGALTLAVNYIRGDIGGDWSAFAGQIGVVRTRTGTTVDNFRIASNTGFGTAAIDLGPYVSALTTLNATNTFTVGALSGDANATLGGISPASGTVGSYTATYAVGGRNTDATFAGVIANGTSPSVTAITKTGSGTWTLSGANTYTGPTMVQSGTLNVTGSISGTASLTVAGGSTLLLGGGSVSVRGSFTNNGTVRLTGAASLSASGAFINNGILDLINSSQVLPPDFVNNGTVLSGSGITVNSVTRAANGTCTVVVPGYAGHAYQLQSTASLTAPSWQNTGSPQSVPGTQTGSVAVSLVDPGATGKAMFYRVVITPSP